MGWINSLKDAEQQLEESYNNIERAIQAENNLTGRVESHLDDRKEDINGELDNYESELQDAYSMINNLGHEDSKEAATAVENAGQHLVNAYVDATRFYNEASDIMHEGEDAIDQEAVLVSLDSGNSGAQIMNQATTAKEEAFEGYDQLLQETATKVTEMYSEEGMAWHMDVGLEHQRPSQ